LLHRAALVVAAALSISQALLHSALHLLLRTSSLICRGALSVSVAVLQRTLLLLHRGTRTPIGRLARPYAALGRLSTANVSTAATPSQRLIGGQEKHNRHRQANSKSFFHRTSLLKPNRTGEIPCQEKCQASVLP
jgi:hypothetical protein